MKASIIVDLLFGDGGKGITADFLTTRNKWRTKIVIRFSGGPQAAHNVRIGDVTHTHSNFASGALRGYPSYFTEHTVINPVTIYREQKVLKEKNCNSQLYLHPKANVLTSYDIAYNRITEKKNQHGSCGMGVGAAMSRNENTPFKLFVVDLNYKEAIQQKLNAINNYYMSKLSPEDIEEYKNISDEEMKYFWNALDKVKYKIESYKILKDFDELIFEGSQGILLDMSHGFFPNVTYANTTSKNAIEVCEYLGLEKSQIEIYLVTRCYQTRHGNGWMSNEKEIKLINTYDEINVENKWQSKFRIGEVDYDLINYAIGIEEIYSPGIYKNIVVTCLDQRPGFKFDYNKIKLPNLFKLESYSSDSKYFKIKTPNVN
jgi:adenylosuccinate synthase